jgi:phosphopantothenoylcysteine decarboxylase/phosphopantothenate--cysteine ligase
VHTIRVESAQEMHDAVHAHVAGADIFIGVAAVADYRPTQVAEDKIKKTLEKMTLDLERTPDILSSVAALKPAPFTVGFAAETENIEQHARQKLETKKLDLVAANRVGADTGFGTDENSLLLVEAGTITELPLQPKSKLARALITHIAARYRAKHTAKVHTLRRP